jgi:hypothetical protein
LLNIIRCITVNFVKTFNDCAIFTIFNTTVTKINNEMLKLLLNAKRVYTFVNKINFKLNEKLCVLLKVLQIIDLLNLLLFILRLKISIFIILLRNLMLKKRLCNSTCIVITKLINYSLKVRFFSEQFSS